MNSIIVCHICHRQFSFYASFIFCHQSVSLFTQQWAGLGGWVGCASDWRPGGLGFDPGQGRQHSFAEIDHEVISTIILSLPLIQEWQLSVSGERICTILVNRLEDQACPVNVWLGKLTALDMTPLCWLGRTTSTQTNKLSNEWVPISGRRTGLSLLLYAKARGTVCAYSHPLRKHAYSNILKNLPPKTESFHIKILIFFIFLLKT